MEQTLFIAREVDLYKIPPRAGRGHISGEWRVDDKIATQRCRVVATDTVVEVRLDDPATGEIFGVCPIPRGQREACVESAVDSSRNFVLKLVDPESGRHAFIGMNFAERSAAFDFNVALTDFERTVQRQEELKKVSSTMEGGGTNSAARASHLAATVIPEAAALYRHEDLSLKEGQSIRIEVKKSTNNNNNYIGGNSGGGGGFLSRLSGALGGGNKNTAQLPALVPLAPPPSVPQPSTTTATTSASSDVFGAANFDNLGGGHAVAAPPSQPSTAPQGVAPTQEVAATQEDWATF